MLEKVLGEEHPDLSKVLNNIAMLYYKQGRYEEAKPLYDRAYKILLKTLGEQHPLTKKIKENMELNAARK